jgi:hypothetical protein
VGLFTENGPYHDNDDGGDTLYENVYAWNKVGYGPFRLNILIESQRALYGGSS